MLDINYVSMIKGVSQLFVTFGMIDPIIKSAYNENSTRRVHIHIFGTVPLVWELKVLKLTVETLDQDVKYVQS